MKGGAERVEVKKKAGHANVHQSGGRGCTAPPARRGAFLLLATHCRNERPQLRLVPAEVEILQHAGRHDRLYYACHDTIQRCTVCGFRAWRHRHHQAAALAHRFLFTARLTLSAGRHTDEKFRWDKKKKDFTLDLKKCKGSARR